MNKFNLYYNVLIFEIDFRCIVIYKMILKCLCKKVNVLMNRVLIIIIVDGNKRLFYKYL